MINVQGLWIVKKHKLKVPGVTDTETLNARMSEQDKRWKV